MPEKLLMIGIDKLFADYTTEMSVEKRKNIFAEFQKHMYENAVAMQLGNFGLFQVVTAKLQGFVPYRIPRLWGVWLEA